MPYKYAPYSHSKLQVASCPFLFKWRYIARKPIVTKEPKDGIALHEAQQLYVDHCLKTKQASDLSIIPALWERACEKAKLMDDSGSADMFADLARNTIVDPNVIMANEYELAFKEDFTPCDWWDKTGFFRVKIDRVDVDPTGETPPTIVDYKTQFNLPSQSDVERMPQMKTYAWAGFRVMFKDADEIIVRLIFPRYGCAVREVRFKRGDVDRYQEQIMRKIERVEKLEKFLPVPSDQCAFCGLLSTHCPLKDNPYAEVNEANAVQAAMRYVQLAEELKRLKKALSVYAEERGDIDIGSGTVGYHPKEKKDMDVAKALAWLRANAVDAMDSCLSVPLTGLQKKLGKERYAAIVEAAVSLKVSSEFGFEERDEDAADSNAAEAHAAGREKAAA